MQPVKSTAEILAFKALNRDIDKSWIDWAVDMLLAGFDTENLIILAGESEPFNQFQMQKLTDKVLNKLHLDYSDKEKTIKNYVYYLVSEALSGDIDISRVLGLLKDLCIKLDYEDYLYDFYSLYFAKEDLFYSDNQWYWEGADKDNINVIIWELFSKWKASYEENESILTERL
jgi:hypothetical protein